MSANPTQNKAPWLLGILLLLQVLLMSTTARHPGTDESILRVWVMSTLVPVVKLGGSIISGIGSTIGGYVELRHVRQDNIALHEQIEHLTAERDMAMEKAAMYDQLRSQLAIPPMPLFNTISANVIARDTNLWFRWLTIDRGSLSGLKKDMPVVTSTGVIGRLISCGPNYSQVQLVTDNHAGMGAMLQNSREMGELRGRGDSLCELRNIRTTTDVQIGESVITTGLDGIYPKGLTVGVVERIEADPNAPWHKILVRPSSPVDRTENVLVMIIELKDLKAMDTTK